jgi:dolichol-phosphate mannosyltransferase
MDADFSHDPKYISNFLYKIKENDLVLGSRYIKGVNVVNWPMTRLLISYMANIYARIVTGIPVKDSTGGFKCFRIEALKALDLDSIHSDGYSFQIEVTYKLWKRKFRICEIPIVFVDRTAGESKMSGKIIREALFLLFKLRFGK